MPGCGRRVALHINDNPSEVHSVSCFQGIRPQSKVTGRNYRFFKFIIHNIEIRLNWYAGNISNIRKLKGKSYNTKLRF
jgi:hypothetical protein